MRSSICRCKISALPKMLLERAAVLDSDRATAAGDRG